VDETHREPGRVQLAEIIAWLRERLPEDAIVANGAGNFAGWISRFYRYPGLRTQVAPTNGSMGYGVPAGVARKWRIRSASWSRSTATATSS